MAARGQPSRAELVFDFPFNEELNEAVKRLPKRWFDWRRKHWRVPADPRIAKSVERLLGALPGLVADPGGAGLAQRLRPLARARLGGRLRGRAARSSCARSRATLRRSSSEAADAGEGRHLLPFSMESADLLYELDGAQLDDLARGCARELSGRHGSPRRPS